MIYAEFYSQRCWSCVCFQGDPGVPGFKGEAGPKGEPVSLHMLCKMKRKHKGLYEYFQQVLRIFKMLTMLMSTRVMIVKDKPQSTWLDSTNNEWPAGLLML